MWDLKAFLKWLLFPGMGGGDSFETYQNQLFQSFAQSISVRTALPPNVAKILTGTYVGDGTASRAIPVGFRPILLTLQEETITGDTIVNSTTLVTLTSTGFTCDNIPSTNEAGKAYRWTALTSVN